jgi:uncharacterized protein
MARLEGAPTLTEPRERRGQILRVAAARGARSVCVFGSVARGQAGTESDVDLLVDMELGRGVLDLSELILDLRELLGRDVDVVEIRTSSPLAERVIQEAVPL